jgi:chromosome segregation ATPase
MQEQLVAVTLQAKTNDDAENEKDKKIESLLAETKVNIESIEKLKEEKQRLSGDISKQLTATEKELETLKESTEDLSTQLASKDEVITALQKGRSTNETQLMSLQGEYDSLDSKYQKLLQPARSSKGKFIVSISYKKIGKRRVIRLKSNPKGSYKTVKKSELHKVLVRLKKKHKTDLYLKVIIPSNSGLSYNEAWTFTSNLQKKYDYYFQSKKK